MCRRLHFTSQWDGWVLSIYLHTHWKDFRETPWKWGDWADWYLSICCRLQPGQFISVGRKDMTTCSKYLEGCVTQGGVLGAEGWNLGREKKRRWTRKVTCMESFLYWEWICYRVEQKFNQEIQDQKGETCTTLCCTGESATQEQNTTTGLIIACPHDCKKLVRGETSYREGIYLGLRKRRGQEGQCSTFSWEKTWETNS